MKYSVITPLFNRNDTISRCIESVARNLTYCKNLEHIIVDDGSSDKSALIAESYALKMSHIKFIHFLQNKGTNAARNEAIKIAGGDFCIFLDSDDFFVDNALEIIDNEVSKGEYKEYMFAADDMVPLYNSNVLLGKRKRVEITYENFLRGDVGGDFIHVVWTPIAKKFPFPETVRIHEIITFLQFYKESQVMLFVNSVVTIRERNRSDSVTRTVIRTNKQTIQRNLDALTMQLNLFEKDYLRFGLKNIIWELTIKKIENALLLSQYKQIKKELFKNELPSNKKIFLLKIIYVFRLGLVYRLLLKYFLIMKYNFLKMELK